MLEPPRILNINVDLGQEAVRTIKAAEHVRRHFCNVTPRVDKNQGEHLSR